MSPNGSTPSPGVAEPADTVSALEALQGLPIAGIQGLAGIRLAPVVAATLRAVVDLVLGDDPPRRHLTAAGDDGALEVTVPEARLENLLAAGSLLETIDGNLSPAAGSAYRMRVPVAAPRALFLMLEQGTLRLAVPWHTVIRIRLVRGENIEELARREGTVALDPWVKVPRGPGERPAILVGLGMRHAFLGADRLVWRMPAEEAEGAGPPPTSNLARAVRTLEGEVFWVVDPGRLLRDVEPPRVARASRPPGGGILERMLRPEPPKRPIDRPQPVRPSPPKPRLVELRPTDVEPLPLPSSPEPTATVPAAAPVESPPDTAPVPVSSALLATPSPSPVTQAKGVARRALVAEDSIVGRIFLQRLLEPLGFEVESVVTARALDLALRRGPWDVVFVDVELPDSPWATHLKAMERQRAPTLTRVALVRDREDERLAEQAGIVATLRKPFERQEVLRVLREQGLSGQP